MFLIVRTTLTLDEDVGERLRETAHRERKPFRTVVNEALRLGLGLRGQAVREVEPFEVRTFRSSFAGGIDEARLNQLADQLEAEDLQFACSGAGNRGNLITDAHLAALAMEYQGELHSNHADYARFPGLRWVNPIASG